MPKRLKSKFLIQSIFTIYSVLWRFALPLLKSNKRLKHGLNQRLSASHLRPVDLWIQAASAGEAYLAAEILGRLNPPFPMSILATSTTRQGMDILKNAVKTKRFHPELTIFRAWFPFDIPQLMDDVIVRLLPKAMVLIETELWPGLLSALEKNKIPTVIANGRLSRKSFKGYHLTSFFWKLFAPSSILAISEADAERFKTLFPDTEITVIQNLKFDTVNPWPTSSPDHPSSLFSSRHPAVKALFKKDFRLTILASIREPEEPEALMMIKTLLRQVPDQVIAVFPRHMHRINSWKKRLTGIDAAWQLRSQSETPVSNGTILLWDTFGELKQAYCIADAAFVGGSLKPLGGQNFLESVFCGAATVTGPYIDDFEWVGNEIFQQCLVRKAASWEEAAHRLIQFLNHPPDRHQVMEQSRTYFHQRQGGTTDVCCVINELLSNHGRNHGTYKRSKNK